MLFKKPTTSKFLKENSFGYRDIESAIDSIGENYNSIHYNITIVVLDKALFRLGEMVPQHLHQANITKIYKLNIQVNFQTSIPNLLSTNVRHSDGRPCLSLRAVENGYTELDDVDTELLGKGAHISLDGDTTSDHGSRTRKRKTSGASAVFVTAGNKTKAPLFSKAGTR